MAEIKQLKQNLSGGGGEIFYPITSLDAVKRDEDETSLKEILQTMQDNMGDAFSDSKSYAIGEYCIYQDVLYKFIATKSAGAWDAGAVSATTVAAEMASFANQISELNSGKVIKKAYRNITTDRYGFFSISELQSDISNGYTIISAFAKDAAFDQNGSNAFPVFSVDNAGGVVHYGYLYKASGRDITILSNALNVTMVVILAKLY